jgi:hypothetical protein
MATATTVVGTAITGTEHPFWELPASTSNQQGDNVVLLNQVVKE